MSKNLNFFKFLIKPLIFINIYGLLRGAYGEVRLAFQKDTCEKYAIKIISKKKFTLNGKHQMVIHYTLKYFQSEIYIKICMMYHSNFLLI